MRASVTSLIVVILGTWCPAVAEADPLRVMSGSVAYDSGDPWYFVLFAPGFSAAGSDIDESIPWRFDDPGIRCTPRTPCAVGSILDLSATYSGGTLGDGLWQRDESRRVYFDGEFRFHAATATVPADGWLDAPFTFSGVLLGFDNQSRTGPPLFEQALVGSGQLSLLFEPSSPGFAGVWDLRYTFQNAEPVPEPASMLLFGAGLAALGIRRRMISRHRASAD